MRTPRTRPSSSDRDPEAGFSVIEMVVIVALLAIVSVSALSSMTRATETAHFSTLRNESLDQLRIMSANFTKDVRQAVRATAAAASDVTMDTYVAGTIQSVRWRVVPDADGDDELRRIVGGGPTVTYVVDLTSSAVFSFFGKEADPASINRIQLNLGTRPDPRHPTVEVSTVVEMRNAP